MQKTITKEELYNKLKELSKNFEVIGPHQLQHKGVFYEIAKDTQDIYLGEEFAVEPVKKFFLEPSSCMLEYNQEDGAEINSPSLPDQKRIVIGARPCETRGLELLDNIYDSESHKDDFYVNNRKRSIVIGLSCGRPDDTCFCNSMESSPVEARGVDALLFNTGSGFITEVITDKGEEIFGSLGKELDEAGQKGHEEDKNKRKNLVKKKTRTPGNLPEIFEDDYWKGVSDPCLGCGVCTYLCPTCHCFDLVDEEKKRLRCYDGCAFPDFTLEASGHNPRPTKRERYRQRVYHKFDYFKRNFGENLCVGCGRCIRHCPVKIDIADIVDKAPVPEKE